MATAKMSKADRQRRVEAIYETGLKDSVAIAARLAAEGVVVTDRTVRSDLAEIAERWWASITDQRHWHQMGMIGEAERDNAELLREWERSKKPKERKRQKAKEKGGRTDKEGKPLPGAIETEAVEATEGRLGDPAYMRIRHENREFIRDTLGLKEAETLHVSLEVDKAIERELVRVAGLAQPAAGEADADAGEAPGNAKP